MDTWKALASGTRLWRKSMIWLLVSVIVTGIIQSVVLGVLKPSALTLENRSAIETWDTWAVIFSLFNLGVNLAYSAALVVVGRRWQKAPAIPGGLGKANLYTLAALLVVCSQSVGIVLGFTQTVVPQWLSLVVSLIGTIMIFLGLALQRVYLTELRSPLVKVATSLSAQLALMIAGVIVGALLMQVIGWVSILVLIGLVIGLLIWFVRMLSFLNDAATSYETTNGVELGVFD